MLDVSKALAMDSRHSVTDKEILWLGERALTSNVVIELGSFFGRSTRAMADNTPGVLYAVDTWDYHGRFVPEKLDPKEVFHRNLADLIGWKVIPLNMSSKRAFESANLPKADLIFIDTDHSYNTTLWEVTAYKTQLTPTGLLCGHDYDDDFPGVIKAVNEVFGAENIDTCGSIWWWIR